MSNSSSAPAGSNDGSSNAATECRSAQNKRGRESDAVNSTRKGQTHEGPSMADYECSCCQDLLLDPVCGPCGHDLCKECYEQWKASCRGAVVCPLCRAPMPSSLGVCLRLQKTVEALYPDATKRRRAEVDSQPRSVPTPTCASDRLAYSMEQAMAEMSASYMTAHWQWMTAMASAMQQTFQHQQQQMMALTAMRSTGATPAATPMQAPLASSLPACGAVSSPAQPATAQAAGAAPASSVVGTPVIDAVCERQWLQQQYDFFHSAVTVVAGAPRGMLTAGTPCPAAAPAARVQPVQPPQQPGVVCAPAPHWQSVADVPQRLECARAIVRLVQMRGLHRMLGPSTLAVVRAVEVALYRSASSREAYLDASTLEARVAQVVRKRVDSAAARRRALQPCRPASGAAATVPAAVVPATGTPAAAETQQQEGEQEGESEGDSLGDEHEALEGLAVGAVPSAVSPMAVVHMAQVMPAMAAVRPLGASGCA